MFRRLTKWTVLGAVGLVALVALVGVTRVKTAFWSVRDHLRSNVDELVDTRVALQHEIRKLQKDYPERIADLRCQLAEIDRDLEEVRQDEKLCTEVVSLCESDVAVLKQRIAVADSDADGVAEVPVEFRAERLDHSEALTRASRIAETAASYRTRQADLKSEAKMLREEKTRMRAELADMEREYRDFQAEVGTLNREIESLKRKEKLVEVAERQQRDRDDIFSDRASALAVVKERIEKRKIQLEERLRGLRSFPHGGGNEYEARARVRLTMPHSD